MLDFMIIGLPRSGTTWAANFFCTERTLCFHDPLYTTHYQDWDTELPKRAQEGAEVGVSCTGIWRWPDWVNEHPARKVILHRDLSQIADSMREIGLPEMDLDAAEEQLSSIIGMHVPHSDLFDEAKAWDIWWYLTKDAGHFPTARHRLLVDIEMQPKFSGLSVGPEVTRRLQEETQRAAGW